MFDVTVAQKDLKDALALLKGVASPKSVLPAQACVRAEVQGEELLLEASDSVMSIGVKLPIRDAKKGSDSAILLPNVFIGYAEAMPAGLVNILGMYDRGPCAIFCSVAENRRFSSPTIPEGDWPIHARDTANHQHTSVKMPVRKMIPFLSPLVTYADDKHGAYVAFSGGVATRRALDGNRIFIGKEDAPASESGTFIFSKHSLKLFLKMLKSVDPEDDVEMTVYAKDSGARTFVGKTKDRWIRFPLLPEFLDLTNVIPTNYPSARITCNRAVLEEKVRGAIVAIDHGETQELRVVVSPDGVLRVGVRCPEDESRKNKDLPNFRFVDQCDVKLDGFVWSDPYKKSSRTKTDPDLSHLYFAISPDYFMDAIGHVETEEIVIAMDLFGPTSAVIVPSGHSFDTPPIDSAALQFVMLMQV